MKHATATKGHELMIELGQLEALFKRLHDGHDVTLRGEYADQAQFEALRVAWAQGLISAQAFSPLFRDASLAALDRLRAKRAEFEALKDE